MKSTRYGLTRRLKVEKIVTAVSEVVEYLRDMSPLWKDKISGKKSFVLEK